MKRPRGKQGKSYRAAMLVKDGMRPAEAAAQLKITSKSVYRACKRLGIGINGEPVRKPRTIIQPVGMDEEATATFNEFASKYGPSEALRLAKQDYEVRIRRKARAKARGDA